MRLCALVITLPANRLRCSNFPLRTHQARPGEDRTNHQGLRLQALLVVSMKPSQWDGSPLTAQLSPFDNPELAGTRQMQAVPGTAASILCCLAAPAMLSLAVQEGFLCHGWGSVPAGVWGQRVGAPTGEMWGGWWHLWVPFFGRGRAEGGCGGESLQSLRAVHVGVVGLRGSQSSLGQGRSEQSSFVCVISLIVAFARCMGEPLKSKRGIPEPGPTHLQ